MVIYCRLSLAFGMESCLTVNTIVAKMSIVACIRIFLTGKVDGKVRKMVLSLLVDNTAGVLSRVSGLFSRRGYNIDSLSVGVTENPKYSRMTVAVSGDELTLAQIAKQLNKLEDVVDITELKDGESVCRELVLVKVKTNREEKQQIISITDVFRAKIVDVSVNSLMIELTGNANKIEAFIGLLDGFEIESIVRTGLTGLTRGSADLK